MNIDTSSYTAALGTTSSSRAQQSIGVAGSDGDADDRRVHHGHHHGHGMGQGGGRLQQALTEALQSLGLTLPSAGAGQQADSAAGAKTDDDDGDDNKTESVSAGKLRHDMHEFMHAMFQALRGERSAAAEDGTANANGATSANGASGGRHELGSALTALIADASKGTAPAGLQQAFSTLMGDLQSVVAGSATAGSTDGGTSGASSSATGTAAAPTLQALLTQMQQDLGYGKSSTAAATGNVLSTQA